MAASLGVGAVRGQGLIESRDGSQKRGKSAVNVSTGRLRRLSACCSKVQSVLIKFNYYQKFLSRIETSSTFTHTRDNILPVSIGDDRLCGLVVRVLGYRSGGPGSIPGTAKKK
jgi:hypothetical protein